MQVKNALNWKIFVFLLCDINQQYQRVLDTRSNTRYAICGRPGAEVQGLEVDRFKGSRFRGSEVQSSGFKVQRFLEGGI